MLFSMANSKRLCQDDASYAPVGPHRHDLAAEGGQGLMQLAVVAPTGRQAAAAKCSTPGGRACRWRRGEPRRWARGARRANACRHHQSGPRARNPAQACSGVACPNRPSPAAPRGPLAVCPWPESRNRPRPPFPRPGRGRAPPLSTRFLPRARARRARPLRLGAPTGTACLRPGSLPSPDRFPSPALAALAEPAKSEVRAAWSALAVSALRSAQAILSRPRDYLGLAPAAVACARPLPADPLHAA